MPPPKRKNSRKSNHLNKHLLDSTDLDVSNLWMEGPRRQSQMTGRWRSEEKRRDREQYSSAQRTRRSRSPPGAGRRTEPQSALRRRFDRDREDYPPRSNRKRDYSPEPRRSPPRRPSLSPAKSPRLGQPRRRYPGDSAYTSRDTSPARYPKRLRTRSPSPSDWSERGVEDRRRWSRSRSRERYPQRDTRPDSRRGPSPRRGSPPRHNRPVSRGIAPNIDSYIPERRRPGTPPRQRPRRSPSPRRSPTPPSRRRSPTPPRRYQSGPVSPSSRYNSPLPHRRGRPRDISPDPAPRRRPHSRSSSTAGDFEQDSMDGPFALRGQHGNPNYMNRGRGRGYGNRGSYRGSATPNSSYHGSPQSNTSYHGGRGAWENGPPHHNGPGHSGPPVQRNFAGAGQSQEEYFRSQQKSNHSNQSQPHRPFRGGRGHRGGPFQPQGPDRKFLSDEPCPPPAPRGRGGQYNNLQWNGGAKRGGGPNQPATGPNSIRTSPALSHKGSRDTLAESTERPPFQPPRGPQMDEDARQDREIERQDDTSPNSQRDNKFSFAFKSKPLPQPAARPPADLTSKAKLPPTRPANDRPPPTQPRNKFYDKLPPPSQPQADRRDGFDPLRRPPKGPQNQHLHHSPPRPKHPSIEPRNRSRSPPPKRLKQGEPPTPAKPTKPTTMPPEYLASDSIYYRKPGNESVVGAGTYGKVFKATHIYTSTPVALKKIRMEGERDGFPITAVREIKLLQNLRHRHVITLQEIMVEKNECFMVFEYMSHDLTGLINHPTFKLSPAHKKDLGRQIFEGLEFLHRRGVMHRDIKAANLLVSERGELKYADFGLARFYTKSRKLDYTNRVITIWYRPPELLLGETQYGPAVDVWSAACVFMEMFTRKAIFPGEGGELSQLERIYNVLGTPTTREWPGMKELPWYELMQPAISSTSNHNKPTSSSTNTSPTDSPATHPHTPQQTSQQQRKFESNYAPLLSPQALDLVTQIFRFDPSTRPDAAEILNHPYFVSEEPAPRQPIELAEVGGEWHEYESKAHRKENERRKKEEFARERERERRKAGGNAGGRDGGGEGTGSAGVCGKEKERGDGASVDQAPPAPLAAGEEDEGDAGSDGEGSARMSMS